jgi:hypothetical protein
MMSINGKWFLGMAVILMNFACKQQSGDIKESAAGKPVDTLTLRHYKTEISALLDSFNVAAARADYNKYFDYFAEDGIFIGTDASENWNKQNFKIWAKPYFDKGTTWNFTSLQRNIYFDQTGNVAWFDELLKTQMKICRGSGVLTRHGSDWKVQQYVLSMTIPNSLVDSVVTLKTTIEDDIIKGLLK